MQTRQSRTFSRQITKASHNRMHEIAWQWHFLKLRNTMRKGLDMFLISQACRWAISLEVRRMLIWQWNSFTASKSIFSACENLKVAQRNCINESKWINCNMNMFAFEIAINLFFGLQGEKRVQKTTQNLELGMAIDWKVKIIITKHRNFLTPSYVARLKYRLTS